MDHANNASPLSGMTYSRFIAGLNKAGLVDRKVLADLAVNDKAAIANTAKDALAVLFR